jgi:hypothetical protein
MTLSLSSDELGNIIARSAINIATRHLLAGLPKVCCGSKPEPLPNARMSAFASCGHPSHGLWPASCQEPTLAEPAFDPSRDRC